MGMNQEKFIELVTKELLGEISEEEKIELGLLLKSDPSYVQERANFKVYWESDRSNKSDEQALFQKISKKIKEQEPDFNTEKTVLPLKRLFPIIWKAAAVLIILGSAYLFVTKSTVNVASSKRSMQTRNGEKRTLILPDGTKVTVNSASRLSYPTSFKDSTREVYLTGEAFFDVKKDHLHPFIIHTGKMDVRVLGTAFNVKAYKNDKFSETTLIRGSVQIMLSDRPKDIIILKPMEKLVVKYAAPVTNDSKNIGEESNALPAITYLQKRDNIIIETSWLENKLIFKDEDFKSLANSLERQYGVSIEFENESLKELRFSGIFEKETITEALSALRLTEHFNFKILKDKIIIY